MLPPRFGQASWNDKVAFLFDASAVINMVLQHNGQSLASAKNNFALELTGYEAGNAVWRLCLLEKKITHEEASKLIDATAVFLAHLGRVTFWDLNPSRILDIAISERTTFYDASYVAAAETKNLTLVTDDRELLKVAKQYVPARPLTQK
jgi:predicted nucleic acid-binding protein